MSLDGSAFVAVVALATALGVLAAAAWLPHTRRTPRGFVARVATVLGVSALVVLLVAVVANRSFHFYADWSDLVGTADAATGDQSASAGGSAAGAVARSVTGSTPLTAPLSTARPALPDPGQRLQTFTVAGSSSKLTGQVEVSLPAGYEDAANAGRTYPVLVALHGWPGHPNQWVDAGLNLLQGLDDLQAKGSTSGVIVVIPALEHPDGIDTECVDGPSGAPQVETWLSSDVPAFVVSHLRAATGRSAWSTIGFSSGGYCSALLALRHPDLFGSGIVLGGYFTPFFESASYRPYAPGDARWSYYDLVSLVRSNPPPVALWVETSAADSLSYATSSAVLAAARAPLSVESHVETGAGHRASVWADAIPGALAWLAGASPGFAA